MKRKRAKMPFLDQLRKTVESLKKMKPGEVHILSVNANYGHYQIVIGPENHGEKGSDEHGRPIEINGEIHHLFVTPGNISAQPSRKQVLENMKNTVIMRNLSVHLNDPRGDGRHISAPDRDNSGLHAREYINLAGDTGEELLEKVEHSGRFSLAAYRIVQQDILRALKKQNGVKENSE